MGFGFTPSKCSHSSPRCSRSSPTIGYKSRKAPFFGPLTTRHRSTVPTNNGADFADPAITENDLAGVLIFERFQWKTIVTPRLISSLDCATESIAS